MKHFIFFLLATSFFILISCGGSKKLSEFDEKTVNHQRIAVLPFQSKIKLTPKQKESIEENEIINLQISQGKNVQEAVESYLVDHNLKVSVQSSNITNSKLMNSGIDLSEIQNQNYIELAKILEVDALVAGYIETEKPMSENVATGIDIAKNLERSLLGTSFSNSINTSTNKGMCRLSLFDGSSGDRLWSYNNDIEMKRGSSTHDMIEVLMKKGAKNFPYKN